MEWNVDLRFTYSEQRSPKLAQFMAGAVEEEVDDDLLREIPGVAAALKALDSACDQDFFSFESINDDDGEALIGWMPPDEPEVFAEHALRVLAAAGADSLSADVWTADHEGPSIRLSLKDGRVIREEMEGW